MTSQDSATTQPNPASSLPTSEADHPADSSEETSKPTNPRLEALTLKLHTLTTTLNDLQSLRAALAQDSKLPSGLPIPSVSPQTGLPLTEEENLASALKASNTVIKSHIAQLHAYNEIKDIGQGLMGLVAERRGCRIVGVMEEFGVEEGD